MIHKTSQKTGCQWVSVVFPVNSSFTVASYDISHAADSFFIFIFFLVDERCDVLLCVRLRM